MQIYFKKMVKSVGVEEVVKNCKKGAFIYDTLK